MLARPKPIRHPATCPPLRSPVFGFAFSRHWPLVTRHFRLTCLAQTIPCEISLCLRDSLANSGFALPHHSQAIEETTTHQLPLTSRSISNRHKRGLEMTVTPFRINKSVASNRHRFGVLMICILRDFHVRGGPSRREE